MEFTAISPQKVLAWHLDCRNVAEPLWLQLSGLLSIAEKERAERFYFDHDRKSYIAAHALTRAMLGLLMKVSPSQIEFITGAHGKPEVLLPQKFPHLRVNLSHTRHMVAVAITETHDIGIDIEWLGRRDSCLDLAKTVFTSEEQAILADAPDHHKKEIFLTLWTLKEAYIKAIGKGLSLPLTDFHFTFDPLAIHFKRQHERENIDDPESWYLSHFRPGPDHVAAIAAQGANKEILDCTIETAPLPLITETFIRS